MVESTPNVSNAGTAEDSDEFRRRTAIVADGQNVAQRRASLLRDFVEHIHQAVGRTSTRENYNAFL